MNASAAGVVVCRPADSEFEAFEAAAVLDDRSKSPSSDGIDEMAFVSTISVTVGCSKEGRGMMAGKARPLWPAPAILPLELLAESSIASPTLRRPAEAFFDSPAARRPRLRRAAAVCLSDRCSLLQLALDLVRLAVGSSLFMIPDPPVMHSYKNWCVINKASAALFPVLIRPLYPDERLNVDHVRAQDL